MSSPFQPVLLPASSFQPASAKFHLKIQQDASEIAGVVEKEEVVLLPVRVLSQGQSSRHDTF